MTSSGGAYYVTAVELRRRADVARNSYPAALERAEGLAGGRGYAVATVHAASLIAQAVGAELAAAVYCLAQALEDRR